MECLIKLLKTNPWFKLRLKHVWREVWLRWNQTSQVTFYLYSREFPRTFNNATLNTQTRMLWLFSSKVFFFFYYVENVSPPTSFLSIGGRGSEPFRVSLRRDKVFGAELRILQIQVKPDKESNNREETKQCVIVGTAPHSFTALLICHSGFCSKINIRNGSGRQIYTKLKKKCLQAV